MKKSTVCSVNRKQLKWKLKSIFIEKYSVHANEMAKLKTLCCHKFIKPGYLNGSEKKNRWQTLHICIFFLSTGVRVGNLTFQLPAKKSLLAAFEVNKSVTEKKIIYIKCLIYNIYVIFSRSIDWKTRATFLQSRARRFKSATRNVFTGCL